MKLRDYQERAIIEMDNKFKKSKKVVLSICPSGGKTTTAIQYAIRNNLKTLILAHGTSVLRSQWGEALEKHGADWSDDFTKQFTVQLPHSLYTREEYPDIDLLIVDEAHEFYFAEGMVKKIIKATKPKKTILLTGTPSKFIKRGYPIVLIAAEELIKADFVNEVYFGLASTSEDLKGSDYTLKEDVRNNYTFKDTENALDELMGSIHKRLYSSIAKKVPSIQLSVPALFGKLHKTMIACNNVNQASKVLDYFKSKGVSCVSSNYNNDTDSENVQLFLKDDSIKILVVINRGVLGFNMPSLVNVVDMTCSRNIDRIYQLYARVMRKNPNFKRKYFFKVVPENDRELYRFYLSAALNLLRADFISKYNGKNLNGLEIPVMRFKRPENIKGVLSNKTNKVKSHEKIESIDSFFHGTVSSSRVLIDIYNKGGTAYNEYAFTTLSRVKNINYGKKMKWTDELAYESAKKYNSRSEWGKADLYAYQYAHRNKIVDKCCEHMRGNPNRTAERVMMSAKRFNNRSEWKKAEVNAYQYAVKNKILDKCCKHMEPSITRKRPVINLRTKEIFKSMCSASRQLCVNSPGGLSLALKGKRPYKGTMWAYCDEEGNVID